MFTTDVIVTGLFVVVLVAVALALLVKKLRKRRMLRDARQLGEEHGARLADGAEIAWDAFKVELAQIEDPAEVGERFEAWLQLEVRAPMEVAFAADSPESWAEFERAWEKIRFEFQKRLVVEFLEAPRD